MTNAPAFILTNYCLTVVMGNKNYSLDRSHAFFPATLKALREGDYAEVENQMNMANRLDTAGDLTFNSEEGLVYWKGEVLHSSLSNRIGDMWADGFNTDPLLNFCKNLFQNPSATAIHELYDFLEKNRLPITPDGCFLAYKKVREDYTDCHTGSLDNSVGEVIEMDRDTCDPIRENHCSTGLHFCGLSYLTCFGGERVMIVKVNPKDVTSIPSDYDFAKGRCCKYEVVDEYGGTDVQRYEAWSSSVADWDDEYQDEVEEIEDEGYDNECVVEEIQEIEDDEFSNMGDITNPVRRHRIACGLSSKAVADALDISLNALFQIERDGAHPKPSVVGKALSVIDKLTYNRGER